MSSFPSRVAERAQDIRPARIVLTVLAAPFWLLGLIVGVLWLAVSWCLAAAVIGFGDAGKAHRGTD